MAWRFFKPDPNATPTYGITLPVAPVDGQEFTLVDSLTTPSYVWRFRYNAGSTNAEKWEFVGGSPLRAYPAGTSGNTTAVTTLGSSSWTVTRSGVYIMKFGGMLQQNNSYTSPYNLTLQPYDNGTPFGNQAVFVPTGLFAGATVMSVAIPTLVSGHVVDLRFSSSAAQPWTIGSLWLEIIPWRVS